MNEIAFEVRTIERRLQARLYELENAGKPKGPELNTAARADRKQMAFDSRMTKIYGADWRNKDKPNTQFDRFLQAGMKA